ncbi:MAG: DUF4188 domain-containing protein [Alphaproteobacteria bacterium]|nr:DUF4188 domain-containing protein [Alphaproteobacteria bacterium]MBV9418174.1 DUF4188 domain-containing protein [Alphaproteobacteria bacterium]MBV9540662.1 DUF4188 domain-containing protein [Alphaproteobacteria bacterium]
MAIPHPTTILPGRMTARLDKPIVLFLIGARINRLRSFPKWLWFTRTMPRMLNELEQTPGAGLLWYRAYTSLPNVFVQQYWESFDKLMAYSSDKTLSHQPAWGRYMRSLAADGSIGIWHETYLIEPGKFECIYGNMPPFGLGAASNLVKAEGRLAAAKERFAA